MGLRRRADFRRPRRRPCFRDLELVGASDLVGLDDGNETGLGHRRLLRDTWNHTCHRADTSAASTLEVADVVACRRRVPSMQKAEHDRVR
jgi:hypothetical protein